MLKIGGLFGKASGPVDPLNCIYVYDVLGRVDRSEEFSIDGEEFEKTNWKTVGLGPTDVNDLKSHFVQAINEVFVARYQARFANPQSVTSSESLAATSAIGSSEVLKPLREPSRGLTSRRAS